MLLRRSYLGLFSLIFSQMIYADNLNQSTSKPFNGLFRDTGPWSPRYSGQGLFSNHQFSGFMDGMIPIRGQDNQLFYVDGAIMGGRYSSLVGSLGGGFRQLGTIAKHNVIVGGYLFGDYQELPHQSKWFINPGIELLTKHQEVRIQGYLPVGQRSRPFSALMASQIPEWVINDSGVPSSALTSVQGHGISDTPVSLTHEYGSGLEAEAGQYLPVGRGAWFRVGGYHFDYKNAQSINGAEANVEFFMGKNFSVIVQDNYDNQYKNKFSLGVRFSFGGPDHTLLNHLANRMEEPVIRHIAREPSGLATPIRSGYVVTGPTQSSNDIWFFSPTGTNPLTFTNASCTAENPCIDLNQTIADGIADLSPDNALLWFAPGNYILDPTTQNGVVYLSNGQNIFGRSADFRNIAVSTNQPTINGGLWWNGSGSFNNANIVNTGQINNVDGSASALGSTQDLVVNNARVNASGSNSDVLAIDTYNNAVVNNSIISVSSDTSKLMYGIASNNNLSVNNSSISLLATGNPNQIYGAAASALTTIDNSTITVTNNGNSHYTIGAISFGDLIAVQNSTVQVTGTGNVVGISNYVGSAVVNNSSVIVEGIGAGVNVVNGIFATDSITANQVNIKADGVGTTAQVLGLIANHGFVNLSNSKVNVTGLGSVVGANSNSQFVNVTNSDITISTTTNDHTLNVNGIFAQQNSTIIGSNINVTAGNAGFVSGVLTNTGNVDFEGAQSRIVVNSTSSNVHGAQANTGGVNNQSSPLSTCMVNGVLTNC